MRPAVLLFASHFSCFLRRSYSARKRKGQLSMKKRSTNAGLQSLLSQKPHRCSYHRPEPLIKKQQALTATNWSGMLLALIANQLRPIKIKYRVKSEKSLGRFRQLFHLQWLRSRCHSRAEHSTDFLLKANLNVENCL